jgi:hydroxymethylpyrimidine pyrophosphatase-like HAD family hydrolase
MELFDAVVLENGAVVYWPGTRETETLCAPPPRSLIERLARRGVQPLVSGRVIVATRRPHEVTVLEAIRDLGLELYIVFNGRP